MSLTTVQKDNIQFLWKRIFSLGGHQEKASINGGKYCYKAGKVVTSEKIVFNFIIVYNDLLASLAHLPPEHPYLAALHADHAAMTKWTLADG